MFQWNPRFPIESIRRTTEAAAAALRSRISEGAMAVGLSVLSKVQADYQTKSRHGTGSDGIQWKDLSPRTLEARVRRRSPAQKIIEERKQLAQEIRGILSGGITPRAKRGKGKEASKEKAVFQLRQKRDALKRKLDNLVIKEMSEYQIGVDTGLQRSAAAPGFTDPAGVWSWQPPDALGGNLFHIDGGTVVIGYDRTYSEFFDRERPLMPDQLPAEWREDAEEKLTDWAGNVIRETIAKG